MGGGISGFNGARLVEARHARGVNASSLARIIDVSRQAVSQYEHGICSPSLDILERIATSLDFPVEFFVRRDDSLEHGTIFFRSFSSARKKQRSFIAVRLKWCARLIQYLCTFYDISIPRLYHPTLAKTPLDLTTEEIEDMAVKVRRHWNIGDEVISDISLLLENNGIVITAGEASERIDACSTWTDSTLPLIFVTSASSSAVRLRFTLAHELGHLLLHASVPADDFTENLRSYENQANYFASAFLMPPRTFSADFVYPSLDSFLLKKEKWKVSIQAMVRRSYQLGLIDKGTYVSYFKTISRRWGRKHEPLDTRIPHERPRMLSRCVAGLIDEGIQTRQDVVQSLALPPRDIESIAFLPRGFLTGEAGRILHMPRLHENDSEQ